MKTKILFFILLSILNISLADSKEVISNEIVARKSSINVFASPDVYNLTMQWAGEYGRLNPQLNINVIKSADNEISGMLKTNSGVGIIGNMSHTAINNSSMWEVVVGRDIVVPVMNVANPYLKEIGSKGITQSNLARLFQNNGNQNWATLTGSMQSGSDKPVHCYILNDPSTISRVSDYLNISDLKNSEIIVVDSEKFISSLQKDPLALGFCKLVNVINNSNQTNIESVQFVPIDKNGNGRLDYMEAIYDNVQTLSRGIWIGKYPKALTGNIYSVSAEKPGNNAEVSFLRWVLTDGQRILEEKGYSDLVFSERQSQLDLFNNIPMYASVPLKDSYATLKAILLILFALGIVVFMLDNIVRRIRYRKDTTETSEISMLPVFDENSVIVPRGLYFDKTHTWAFMKKDGTVKIGIDDFLQHVTGPISRIEMKKSGETIKKGDLLLTIIQKGKQLNIYSPVTGTISSRNKLLIEDSSLIHTAPYEDGWVYTIEPSNWIREIQFLNMAEKYKTWIKGEFLRLKDFIATTVKHDSPEYAFVALQDGGTLKDSILADLGPEVWEDFQTKFIDIAK